MRHSNQRTINRIRVVINSCFTNVNVTTILNFVKTESQFGKMNIQKVRLINYITNFPILEHYEIHFIILLS